jgi:signal recognition particle subunit SRP72
VRRPEAAPATEAAPVVTLRKKKKPQKKRKRFPKNFDPTNPNNPPPDPDRWKPRWERASFKMRT